MSKCTNTQNGARTRSFSIVNIPAYPAVSNMEKDIVCTSQWSNIYSPAQPSWSQAASEDHQAKHEIRNERNQSALKSITQTIFAIHHPPLLFLASSSRPIPNQNTFMFLLNGLHGRFINYQTHNEILFSWLLVFPGQLSLGKVKGVRWLSILSCSTGSWLLSTSSVACLL
jgi:hypothetical protein